ncbi:MAG: lecithin retinol acyltransferase family protein [Methylococcales bacterium]
MNIGDHLVTPRTGYTHHGIYIGNGEVIHYSGFANGQSTGTICITTVKAFANGHDVSVREHFFRRYDATESVERAHSRLGEDWYNVLINNCEHFVNWCVNGLHSSDQVNSLIAAAANVYNTANESKKLSTLANVVAGRVVQKEVERQVTQAVVKSVVSKSAGMATTGILTTTGSSGLASSLIAASSSTVLVPVLAPIAIGIGVVCIIDWLWD